MTLATFAEAARGETLDTTIWAASSSRARLRGRRRIAAAEVTAALAAAARTRPGWPWRSGPSAAARTDYWRALFRATYRAELRFEAPGREGSDPFGQSRAFRRAACRWRWSRRAFPFVQEPRRDPSPARGPAERIADPALVGPPATARQAAQPGAALRRATATFDGAARYAAWKVERHTGIPVALTP
jgi:hypothetical protein